MKTFTRNSKGDVFIQDQDSAPFQYYLMDEQKDRELRVVEKEQSQLNPEVDRLSGYIDTCFTAATVDPLASGSHMEM